MIPTDDLSPHSDRPILIFEPDEEVQAMLNKYLRRAQYAIQLVNTPDDAMTYLSNHDVWIFALAADQHPKNKAIKDLITYCHQQRKWETFIIFMVGNFVGHNPSFDMKNPNNLSYLEKPFTVADFQCHLDLGFEKIELWRNYSDSL